MRHQFGILALLTLLATISTPWSLNHWVSTQVLAQTSSSRKAEADRLLEQGLQQHRISQFEAAKQSWQQALRIYREIKNRQSESYVLENLGTAYSALGDYDGAINCYQQSLAIAREIKDRSVEEGVLGNLGVAYYFLADYTKAIDYYQQSIAIAREIKDREGEQASLLNLGNAYRHLGDYTKAIDSYQQSLTIARELKDREGEADALLSLGDAYRHLGNSTKAIESYQQSLVIWRELKNREGEAKAIFNLLQLQDRQDKEASRPSAQTPSSPKAEADRLLRQGYQQRNSNQFEEALQSFQQALTIYRQLHDRQWEGNALAALGFYYDERRESQKALSYWQQVLAVRRELHDREAEAAALDFLVSDYVSLKNYTQALEYQQQSLALARQTHNPEREKQALENLAGIYEQHLGDSAKAVSYLQQGLVLARETQNRHAEMDFLIEIGKLYSRQGDYNKEIALSQQALAIAREMHEDTSEREALQLLGDSYQALGNYSKAIDSYQQMLAIARQEKYRAGEWQDLETLGDALFQAGKIVEAEKTLREGVQVWESVRDEQDFERHALSGYYERDFIYLLLQKVLIAQNKTDAALEVSERGRARGYMQLLREQLSSTPNAQSTIIPPTFQQIQQIAKDQNTTLVEYSVIPDRFQMKGKTEIMESELFIWIIQPGGKVTFRRSNLKPLRQQNTSLSDLVSNTRESIGARGRSTLQVNYEPKANQTERLQQLHKLVIEPIADLLPTDPAMRVTFIPHNALFLVPFAALQDSTGKYLIEKHTILTAPSIQVLDVTHQEQQRKSGSAKQILVVGNPTMPSVRPKRGAPLEQLPSLPGAEQEAKAIAQVLSTQALVGSKATKAAVVQQMSSARIIHLATHGILDEQYGLRNSIALAPSEEDDGFLSPREIMDLKLNAELVVLSACNTGRGEISGDGVVGLSRSFIAAGVPSVIVSLWSIPDAPTASLMTDFYHNLQQKPDKAQALRQAMLTTMKQYPNPKDWAAFTVIGQ